MRIQNLIYLGFAFLIGAGRIEICCFSPGISRNFSQIRTNFPRMNWFYLALQVVIPLGFPWVAQQISRRVPQVKWLSPVLLCYAAGLLIGVFQLFPVDEALVGNLRDGSILLGIPLLLLSTDFRALRGQARSLVLAFFLCVGCGLISCLLTGWLAVGWVPETWRLSGMLVGLYTGGTPNLNAIGLALQADEALILYLNGADIILGGLFLLFLLSFAQRVYGMILPVRTPAFTAGQKSPPSRQSPSRTSFFLGMGITLLIVLISAGLTYWWTGGIEAISILLLLLTTLSLLASLVPSIRTLPGTQLMGDYCLLIFCVALGMLADFSELAGQGSKILLYTGIVFGGTIVLQLIAGALFKIDRDTLIITSTAALYGPVFVPQVAGAIRAPHLLFGGLATGLLGYAIGNYLGLGVAWLLQILTG
jgi:uncharacterized membrane protein